MIKSSPYFNNAAFANAAAGLAELFAPPTPEQVAAQATERARQAAAYAQARQAQAMAQAKEEEAARARWLNDNWNDPSAASRSSLLGIQTYGATPEGFRYSTEMENAAKRYGYDRTFEASRLNNADDNARALTERGMIEDATTQRLGIPDVNARYKVDTEAAVSRGNNLRDNQAKAITTLLNPLDPGQIRPEVSEEFMKLLDMPAVGPASGTAKLPTETEWQATQNQRLVDSGKLTDTDLIDIIMGERQPVQALGADGKPVYMTPGEATRLGAQPYEAASAEKVDNYLAAGPDGKEIRFPGIVGPDGRIVDANTGQVVPNVVRKEGTGGGIKFEADGQGGVRFTTGGAGNTVSQQTNLQGQRDAATQSARELQTLFDNIAASDVGVAGNFNDFLTNYGAQVFPHVARGDVTAMRTQMQTTAMRMARSLAGDNRISDTDRRMAEDIMVGQGLGESLPGAKAKLATLIVLNAYRAKFAGSLASGDGALPPINGGVLGQLVDDGAITPAQADEYQRTMLSSNRGGPTRIPSVGELERDFDPAIDREPRAAPSGVDPADWEFMTPEQKALFR